MILHIHNEKEREILINALVAQENTSKMLIVDQVAYCAENSHRFDNLDNENILYLWDLSVSLDRVLSLKERCRNAQNPSGEPPPSDQEL